MTNQFQVEMIFSRNPLSSFYSRIEFHLIYSGFDANQLEAAYNQHSKFAKHTTKLSGLYLFDEPGYLLHSLEQ